MGMINWMLQNKIATIAGATLLAAGAAAVKQIREDEANAAFGPDYDDRFFKAFAQGYEETKDLTW